MINWITGTEMDVPVGLVERFKAEGHRVADAPAAEPEKKPNRKSTKKK